MITCNVCGMTKAPSSFSVPAWEMVSPEDAVCFGCQDNDFHVLLWELHQDMISFYENMSLEDDAYLCQQEAARDYLIECSRVRDEEEQFWFSLQSDFMKERALERQREIDDFPF